MDLKKSVVCAAEITFMQQKAIDFLKETAAKERAEAWKAVSAAVSITTVTTTATMLTTVATPSVQSQQSTSSVVMVFAVVTTPLMAGQIFRDFLISTRSKKVPIHESIKKCKSYSSRIYTEFPGEGHNILCSIQLRDVAGVYPRHQYKGGSLTQICAALYVTRKWPC
jgi:hypothetical protein